MIYKGDWKNLMPKWELKCQQWELHKVRYPTWQVYQNQFFCFIFVRNLPSSNVVNTLLVCPHMRIFSPMLFSLFRSVSLSCEVYSIVTARKTTRSRWYLETSELDEQKKNNKWKKNVLIKQLFIRVESSCYDPQTVSFFFWQVQNSEHILGLGMANFYKTDQDLCGSWEREGKNYSK